MLSEKERLQHLTQQMRMEIGAVYVLSRTVEPSLKIGHTRHLVSSMIIASQITGEYLELKPILDECSALCTDATIHYKKSNWDAALHICDKILDELGIYVHGGYGKMTDSAFTLPTSQGVAK